MNKERLTFIRKQKATKEYVLSMNLKVAKKFVKHGVGCEVQEGAYIGMDGFSYEQNENGEYEKFPHYGKVIMGDFVHIYAGTNAQRGSMKDTIIGSGCKIAGNCQIGHNSEMGKNCLIGPFCTIGGSAILGDNVKMGQYVQIAHGIKIGNNVKISSYCHITKNIDNDSHVKRSTV